MGRSAGLRWHRLDQDAGENRHPHRKDAVGAWRRVLPESTAIESPNSSAGRHPRSRSLGCGRRTEARLIAQGIGTVAALRDAPKAQIRARFRVVLERTARKLDGESCLALELAQSERSRHGLSLGAGVGARKLVGDH